MKITGASVSIQLHASPSKRTSSLSPQEQVSQSEVSPKALSEYPLVPTTTVKSQSVSPVNESLRQFYTENKIGYREFKAVNSYQNEQQSLENELETTALGSLGIDVQV